MSLMKSYRKILAIDPSVKRIGWALVEGLYQDEDKVWHDEESNWKYGFWDLAGVTMPFILREAAEFCLLSFGGLNSEQDILVAEWPAFFDNMRGHTAATQGYTINLAAIDSYLAGFFQLQRCNIFFVQPFEWKGNISKEITRRRFFKEMGVTQIYKIDHNTVDAVMMLLYWCRKHQVTMKIINRSIEPDYSA